MDVKPAGKDKKTGCVSFLIHDTTPAFANALRRTITGEVPTMAMENIEFRKNNSVLYDEIVAHRLGLIPLKTDLKSYELIENCKCKGEGCPKCSVKLTLKVNAKSDMTVNAGEIESADPKITPVYPDMPIVKLLKGQSLEFEATAVLGKGKDHSKWSPALAYYKYKPKIEIAKKSSKPEAIVKACPKKIFDLKGGNLVIVEKNAEDCHLCGACLDMEPGVIKLNESESDIIFFIEPYGQLNVKQIVKEAVNILNNKLDQFAELIKNESKE